MGTTRRNWLVIALALGALVASAGGQASAAVRWRPRASAPSSDAIDLMSFNVRFDFAKDGVNAWAFRRGIVNRLLDKHRPDVVGVQEALRHQLDDMTASGRYVAIGEGREGGERGEYSPILYRPDRLKPLQTGTFWLSPTPSVAGSTGYGNRVPRIATWARFQDLRTGKRFYVYNTHLDHESGSAQEQGAAQIAAHMAGRARADEPAFLTGDLNVEEGTPVVRRLGAEMIDTFRQLKPRARRAGTFNEWGRDRTGKKIDYIFASPNAGVELVKTSIIRKTFRGKFPSDHFPIKLRVRLK